MYDNAFDAIAAQRMGGPIDEMLTAPRASRRRARAQQTTFSPIRRPRPARDL